VQKFHYPFHSGNLVSRRLSERLGIVKKNIAQVKDFINAGRLNNFAFSHTCSDIRCDYTHSRVVSEICGSYAEASCSELRYYATPELFLA
jgi:hypothetical protein